MPSDWEAVRLWVFLTSFCVGSGAFSFLGDMDKPAMAESTLVRGADMMVEAEMMWGQMSLGGSMAMISNGRGSG